MNVYDSLTCAVQDAYDPVRVLKQSERGTVSVIRHRKTGTCYIFREYKGCCDVYRKLLSVSCPYLPEILEVGEKDGEAVVLEEYIRGDTLADILEGGCLTSSEAKKMMRQLCSALWVLHCADAVHRDIKPDNILVRGSDAVLVDFDASRIYKNGKEDDTQILGTTGYAAPEQYGFSQCDGRADIYAMGVLLNVMLIGKHPSRELASGRMGRIVRRCTMVNPQKRYQNVIQLMEVL